MTDRQRKKEYKKFCKLLYKKNQPKLKFEDGVLFYVSSTIALILLLFLWD